jgi:hypothetical protein
MPHGTLSGYYSKSRSSTSTPRHDTYISYPNGAAEFATAVHADLSRGKVRPWIATKNCEVGDDWRRAQVRVMATAGVHVVAMTEHILSKNDVLRTEVMMSEIFKLPTLCVMSPALASDEKLCGKVYSSLKKGDQAFQRLIKHEWFRPEHVGNQLLAEIHRRLRPKRTRERRGRVRGGFLVHQTDRSMR